MPMNTVNTSNAFMNNMNYNNNTNYINNTNWNNNRLNNMNNVNTSNYMYNNHMHYINNMSNKNIINNNQYIIVIFIYNNQQIKLKVNIKAKISILIDTYKKVAKIYDPNIEFYFNKYVLNPNLLVEQAGLQNNSIIYVQKKNVNTSQRTNESLALSSDINNGRVDESLTINNNIINECLTIPYDKYNDREEENYFIPYEKSNAINANNVNYNINVPLSQPEKIINIKFIKQPEINEIYIPYSNVELYGLLKLCLLKEISPKLNDNQIKQLPDIVANIMKILKNGYIDSPDIRTNIKGVLEKMKGSNIISFSRYVNEIINSNELNNIIALLKNGELNEINDIKNRLSKYNGHAKQFEREFEIAKKKSIFEFSIISLVIIERKDYIKFENERNKCPNREDRILYHGTNLEPICNILTEMFRKSTEEHYQFGKGVYFTDFLDYCWFYGGIDNRFNQNKIPKINETFTLIACSTYYDKNRARQVINHLYTPKKNEMNFAYADSEFETLINPDKSKFYGTEYVIWDLDQICPFISARLERQEYCVIWRDTNFSSKPIHFSQFDELFKKFLKERIKYIEQVAKYNIYPCETSEEALNLIRRKKYNKIILISNVGTDFGGEKFVSEARKIIGNDVIALFLAYKTSHLNWIKNYPNAIFSNDPKFYENYLECFNDTNTYKVKENIETLIRSIENHYQVKFNFNNKYLDFPLYKGSGLYSDLTF